MHDRFLIIPVKQAFADTLAIPIVGADKPGKAPSAGSKSRKKAFEGRVVTMGDPSNFEAAIAGPLGFLKNSGGHMIIDEVQKESELFLSSERLPSWKVASKGGRSPLPESFCFIGSAFAQKALETHRSGSTPE